eukprot:gb/GECH01013983.1/.p1 GENE.gb/GECH01013983.1/~~gb/GECH01013983.1/.p1  ORF type:complete len:270 (+),score=77.74 gb/GECH01013983.1/:1-810(+)
MKKSTRNYLNFNFFIVLLITTILIISCFQEVYSWSLSPVDTESNHQESNNKKYKQKQKELKTQDDFNSDIRPENTFTSWRQCYGEGAHESIKVDNATVTVHEPTFESPQVKVTLDLNATITQNNLACKWGDLKYGLNFWHQETGKRAKHRGDENDACFPGFLYKTKARNNHTFDNYKTEDDSLCSLCDTGAFRAQVTRPMTDIIDSGHFEATLFLYRNVDQGHFVEREELLCIDIPFRVQLRGVDIKMPSPHVKVPVQPQEENLENNES